MGWWRKMVRAGIMDAVIVDEQCVFCDVLEDCQQRHIPVIASNDKIMLGLPDRTNDSADAIVEDLVSFKMPGVAILDPVKAGEVAIRTAVAVKPKRAQFKKERPRRAAIQGYPGEMHTVQSVRLRLSAPHQDQRDDCRGDFKGNLEPFSTTYEICVGCQRCEQIVPAGHTDPEAL